MGILTTKIEVKLWAQTIKYYNDLGYKGKHGDIIIVDVADLPKGSGKIVKVQCDYCGKILNRQYSRCLLSMQTNGKFACKNCTFNKNAEINMQKYGVRSFTCTEEFKEKASITNLQKYGKKSYAQTDECKERKKITMKERYGVEYASQNPEIFKKAKDTCIAKYGTPYPIQLPEFQEKQKQTCKERFGTEYPSQTTEIQEKVAKTRNKHGTTNTSRQQVYLHNLYGGELNFPVSRLNVDICFPNDKLAIEYSGGGHNLQVKMGTMTEKEFERKEVIRNKILKKEGYKIMEIVSSRDNLPSDEILLQMLEYTKNYFYEYSSRSWVQFNVDTSTVRNAEHGEVFFNFGQLRRIKKSDLQEETTILETA